MRQQNRVVIVDGNTIFREGFKELLRARTRFDIVGDANSGSEAILQTGKLKPDTVIMDISLPDMCGTELMRHMLLSTPTIRILALSTYSRVEYIADVLRAGAAGYILKDTPSERVLEGLEAVASGDQYLDASLSKTIIVELLSSNPTNTQRSDCPYSELTIKEREIIRLLKAGYSHQEVADRLQTSRHMLEVHKAGILRKMCLQHEGEPTSFALETQPAEFTSWKN
jgi:DNA-binding NarL/FixJ family response regulator